MALSSHAGIIKHENYRQRRNLERHEKLVFGQTDLPLSLSPSLLPSPPSSLSFSSYMYLSQCSFNTVACNDDSIPLVSAPSLKQLPRQTALHHTRARHDHTRTNVIKLINVLYNHMGSEVGGAKGVM